jgi:uncharacterized protein (TIGR02757 family)
MGRATTYPPRRGLRRRLDELAAGVDVAARRAADPVSFVHAYRRPDDQEVAGLVAASLAFGNVTAVRRSTERILSTLGPHPARTVDRSSEATLRRRFDGFVHRVYRGDDLARALARAGRLRAREGSLGAVMGGHMAATDDDLREALARLADELRGPGAAPGLRHLMPDPRAGSSCKRLLLYLRWMVRPADGVDLGLWDLSPAVLLIPVDTHIHRISRNLGLTARATASWRTAEDITAVLRRFDPHDPVRYDFALCHLGVSRACPSRRDPEKCGQCVLRTVCLRWRGIAA